ncbi:MAG: DNA polymerase III subunit gamma/tau [Paludibacter sp.]|jgi:DNA polymerase-3 subunit gamma/tau|nr:DNA polymerase III subunit gamma/tau [Paludibacter sp.]
MENYIVSARKYRPATFDTVVGQRSLTATLKNAIKTAHLAHAYLFCGPRGVGKTTCARIFAKAINCARLTPEGEACNECESCRSFNDSRSFSIHELDAASNNGVDDIRELIDKVRIPPQIGHYSVYIIDEVHMLSTAAFNSFLKTLEEPPAYAIFILATTEKHKIIPTILSRCQIYDFNRITINDTVQHLKYVAEKEGIAADAGALNVIARKADGGMRDALSIFDQLVSFCGNTITYQGAIDNLNVLDYDYYFRLTDAFLQGDISNSLLIFNEILKKGFDAQHFVTGLSSHFRDLLVSRDEATLQLLEVADDTVEQYRRQALACKPELLFQALKITNECDLKYRESKNKRLLIELGLIRLCQLTDEKKKPLLNDKPQEPIQKLIADSQPAPQPIVREERGTSVGATSSGSQIPQPAPARPASVNFDAAPKPAQQTTENTVAASSVESQTVPLATQNEPFTEQQLHDAWKNFAERITDELNKASFLRFPLPKITAENLLEIELHNTMQENEIKKMQAELLRYLSAQLRNTALSLAVKVVEIADVRTYGSPEERFREMLDNNPALADLQKKLSLEVA